MVHDWATYDMGCRCRDCVHSDRRRRIEFNRWNRDQESEHRRARYELRQTAFACVLAVAVIVVTNKIPVLRKMLGIAERVAPVVPLT